MFRSLGFANAAKSASRSGAISFPIGYGISYPLLKFKVLRVGGWGLQFQFFLVAESIRFYCYFPVIVPVFIFPQIGWGFRARGIRRGRGVWI